MSKWHPSPRPPKARPWDTRPTAPTTHYTLRTTHHSPLTTHHSLLLPCAGTTNGGACSSEASSEERERLLLRGMSMERAVGARVQVCTRASH